MFTQLIAAMVLLTGTVYSPVVEPTKSAQEQSQDHRHAESTLSNGSRFFPGLSQSKELIPKGVTRKMKVTAYSSTPEETDDTPFITAMGTATRDGIVATNMFPFGTKVMIPAYFGDKIFVVEDRMHPRKVNFLDIWMPTKQDALRFGITETEIVILEAIQEDKVVARK